MKKCTVCHIEHEDTYFYTAGKGNGSTRGECKDCARIKRKEYWRKASLKYVNTHIKGRNKTLIKLGIEQSFLKEQIDVQEGKCAICKKETKLCVDHCHKSKTFRGLLCNKCNLGIGHFEDNLEYLKNAIIYLSK